MPFRLPYSDRTRIEDFQESPDTLDAKYYFFSPLWRIGVRGSGVTVAIIDSGINPEKLPANVVENAVDLTGHYDTRDAKQRVYQHGTTVARAVLVIAPDAKVANFKVVHEDDLSVQTVCKAVEQCIDAYPKFKVVNISLAFPNKNCSPSNPSARCA